MQALYHTHTYSHTSVIPGITHNSCMPCSSCMALAVRTAYGTWTATAWSIHTAQCYTNKSCPVCKQHVSSGGIDGSCCLCADEQTDCAVYALDGLGDDISDAIACVTLNPTCTAIAAGGLTCPSCPVEYMQQGLCLPGRCIQTASQATILNSTLWPASVCLP